MCGSSANCVCLLKQHGLSCTSLLEISIAGKPSASCWSGDFRLKRVLLLMRCTITSGAVCLIRSARPLDHLTVATNTHCCAPAMGCVALDRIAAAARRACACASIVAECDWQASLLPCVIEGSRPWPFLPQSGTRVQGLKFAGQLAQQPHTWYSHQACCTAERLTAAGSRRRFKLGWSTALLISDPSTKLLVSNHPVILLLGVGGREGCSAHIQGLPGRTVEVEAARQDIHSTVDCSDAETGVLIPCTFTHQLMLSACQASTQSLAGPNRTTLPAAEVAICRACCQQTPRFVAAATAAHGGG